MFAEDQLLMDTLLGQQEELGEEEDEVKSKKRSCSVIFAQFI
jgi:hypothetical protein